MEFKGTKGEWRAINNGHFWDITPDGSIQCLGSTTSNKFLNIDKEKEEANAKLIAAAPELLEALQEVLPHLGHYADLHVSVQKKVIKAEKAINKALK